MAQIANNYMPTYCTYICIYIISINSPYYIYSIFVCIFPAAPQTPSCCFHLLHTYIYLHIYKTAWTIFHLFATVIAPRPIDQEPSEKFSIGIVIVILTVIIIFLVGAIFCIVTRTKRARGSNVLDAFQYSFNPNTLGGNVDKHRPNGGGIKVSAMHSAHVCTFIHY